MLNSDRSPVGGLYVHVPFCARKCEYCAFYSEASDGALIQRYTEALVRELELLAPELKPETVFFGGGTPSLLNLKQWGGVFAAFERWNLLGAREWTIECNPATVSLDKARLWRSFGVNRVSMGVQSLDEGLLDRLGRVHSRDMVFRSFDTLRRAGFENVNIDLMFGIPGQTLEIWQQTLDEALALGSEHLSSYELIYEEDTPLFDQLNAGEFSVDEDLLCRLYEELISRSAGAGFAQYETANFARLESGELREGELPARACQHNVGYWRGREYQAAGPSASGFVRGVRTRNLANTEIYCRRLESGERAVDFEEELPARERAGEIAAFGLRMNAGWPLGLFKETTGFDLQQEWGRELAALVDCGWAELDSTRFRLNTTGLRFADAAAERFIGPSTVSV